MHFCFDLCCGWKWVPLSGHCSVFYLSTGLSQLPGFDAAVCFDVFREIVLEGEDAWLRLTGAIKREDIPHALFLRTKKKKKKKKKQCGIEFGLNYTLCNKWVCHDVCYNSVFQLFGSRDWSFSSDLFGLTIIFDTDIHFPDKMTSDPFTFHIVSPADQCLLIQWNIWMDWHMLR